MKSKKNKSKSKLGTRVENKHNNKNFFVFFLLLQSFLLQRVWRRSCVFDEEADIQGRETTKKKKKEERKRRIEEQEIKFAVRAEAPCQQKLCSVFVTQINKVMHNCVHSHAHMQKRNSIHKCKDTDTYTAHALLYNWITGHVFIHCNVLLNITQPSTNNLIHKPKYLEKSIWHTFKTNRVAQWVNWFHSASRYFVEKRLISQVMFEQLGTCLKQP